MSATVEITVTLSGGESVSRTATMSDERAADFAGYAASIYGVSTDEEGNEVALTAPEIIDAWINGVMKGAMSNVQRFKEDMARKAVQESIDDVVIE